MQSFERKEGRRNQAPEAISTGGASDALSSRSSASPSTSFPFINRALYLLKYHIIKARNGGIGKAKKDEPRKVCCGEVCSTKQNGTSRYFSSIRDFFLVIFSYIVISNTWVRRENREEEAGRGKGQEEDTTYRRGCMRILYARN